jgi:hypothetical protein
MSKFSESEFGRYPNKEAEERAEALQLKMTTASKDIMLLLDGLTYTQAKRLLQGLIEYNLSEKAIVQSKI